ncbi:MAG: cation:proton antiporter [Chloroflexi bacterium]|nr:cation:proton antiporter [Chloroflexota bacterium]
MENSPVIALFLVLGIIILTARVGGSLARRFDQPRVLGELVVGVLLGPTLLDLLHTSVFGIEAAHLEETVFELAELGVLLLMFKVGLDVHLSELAKVGKVALLAGVLGAVVPVAFALPLALAFGYSWETGLFAGVTLAATSVSISAQVLLELGVLQTKEGNALLATALIDDVVAILLVSLTIAITGSQASVAPGDLVLIVVRMAAYIGIAFAIAWFLLPRAITWVHHHPEASQSYGVPAFALILALVFGWSAEYFGGIATITGAFIAGVGLSRAREAIKRPIDMVISSIAYAFLVPIFFVSVGLHVDLSQFPLAALPFAALLLLIAVISKLIGCGGGAKLGGFTNLESLRLGVCMISRGEVGLIIASLGVSSGVLSPQEPVFATLFLVILLSTVLTPPLVRRVFQERQPAVTEGV